MRLTDEEIDLLRNSFRQLAAAGRATAGMFYDRLFEIAPELRALFPADMEQQGIKMMSMLGAIVAQIHDHTALLPMVSDLARRHLGYGAQPGHYDTVGEALLWTLDQQLGAAFTPPVRSAWERAFAALKDVMVGVVPEPAPGAG